MYTHLQEKHQELTQEAFTAQRAAEVFEFKIIRKHQKAMTRQLHEAVSIMSSGAQLMNNREEYNRYIIPTLSTGRAGEKPQGEKRHQTQNPLEIGQNTKRKRYR